MPYWGKILGTLFGFMFGRIPGAVLGFIVGHMFDKGYSQDFSQVGGFGRFFTSRESVKSQAIFFHALFSVFGHIAKADGRVTEEEIKVASNLMDQMELTGDIRREAQEAFREGKAADFPLKAILKELSDSCYGRKDILQMYLEILIQASCSDGIVGKKEAAILEKVSSHLGFKNHHLRFLISSFEAEVRFRQTWKTTKATASAFKEKAKATAEQVQQEAQRAAQQSRQRESSSQHERNGSHSSRAQQNSSRSQSQQQGYQSQWQQRQSRSGYRQSYSGRSSGSQYTAKQSIADAYRILGVKENEDTKVIKRAYRKLMSEHHPDKLVSKGLPKQAMELAKQKTQDIQAAYESVRKHQGF